MFLYEVLFPAVLDMSLSGSFVILCVLLLRLCLKKAPGIYAYILWLPVGLRLLVPFSIPFAFSPVPVRQNAITYEKLAYNKAMLATGQRAIDKFSEKVFANSMPPSLTNSINPMQILLMILAVIWILGIALLLLKGTVLYLRMRKKLSVAVLLEVRNKVGIYETDWVKAPILYGVWKPAVYLPVGMEKQQREHALAHEMVHVKRRDELVKILAWLIAVIHWFNPLVWVAFSCLTKDMEISCDEAVLKRYSEKERTAYAKTLLMMSTRQSGLLAFGESNTKKRVRKILNYRKRPKVVSIICVLFVFCSACGLMTSFEHTQRKAEEKQQDWIWQTIRKVECSETKGMEEEMEEYEQAKDALAQLFCDYRNPYVGDASKDGRLIGLLVFPEELEWKGMQLFTTEEPYGLQLNLSGMPESAEYANMCFLRAAALLLSTIENADYCIIAYGTKDNPQSVTYTEEDIKQAAELSENEKLYDFSADYESMRAWIEMWH